MARRSRARRLGANPGAMAEDESWGGTGFETVPTYEPTPVPGVGREGSITVQLNSNDGQWYVTASLDGVARKRAAQRAGIETSAREAWVAVCSVAGRQLPMPRYAVPADEPDWEYLLR